MHIVGYLSFVVSLVYTRVLTRVQLTSGPEPISNPPMDGIELIWVTIRVGGVHTGGNSGLNPG